MEIHIWNKAITIQVATTRPVAPSAKVEGTRHLASCLTSSAHTLFPVQATVHAVLLEICPAPQLASIIVAPRTAQLETISIHSKALGKVRASNTRHCQRQAYPLLYNALPVLAHKNTQLRTGSSMVLWKPRTNQERFYRALLVRQSLQLAVLNVKDIFLC